MMSFSSTLFLAFFCSMFRKCGAKQGFPREFFPLPLFLSPIREPDKSGSNVGGQTSCPVPKMSHMFHECCSNLCSILGRDSEPFLFDFVRLRRNKGFAIVARSLSPPFQQLLQNKKKREKKAPRPRKNVPTSDQRPAVYVIRRKIGKWP